MKKKKEELNDEQEVINEEVVEVDEVTLLKEEIERLNAQVQQLKNDYLKAYADTENTRRRLKEEFEKSSKYRIQSFANDILPVIDNLERAISADDSDVSSYKKGVEMIYDQLIHALKKEGVEEISSLDEEFDPNYHQAIVSEEVDGLDSNKVIGVLQKGYKLKDRILRPSMVKVSK